MAGKLPKVTEYIKNVGKSVGYAAIDVAKTPTTNINDFLDTNEELFKTVYSATKNYKQTLKNVEKGIKNSKVYEAVDFGLKNIKNDLRTGEFYNKERERATGLSSVFGDDFADFSEFDMDYNFSDKNDDSVITSSEKELPIEVQAMGKTASGLSSIITANSKAQSQVILASTEMSIKANRASHKLMIGNQERINASIISGFAGVNAGMKMINTMMSGPMTQFMNESTKFYGDVSNKLTETNAYLKEMTEMQRNLYKAQEHQWKSDPYSDIVDASGMPDITKYAKKIYKNIMDMDPTGGMLSGGGDDSNMLKMFLSNPLKAIPMMMAKVIIPTSITKTMEAFDKNMTGLFSSFIARMNEWADSDSGGLINFKGIIGSLLGIKIDNKTKLDTSKYNRGPMPFDGETKKAIVDVIPAYLARIESAISGMPERVYDGRTGKFKTVREVQKEYQKMEKSAIRSAGYGIEEDFETWARERIKNDSSLKSDEERNTQYARLRRSYENMVKQIWEDGGSFHPFEGYSGKRRTGSNRYRGEMTDREYLGFINMLNTLEKRHKIWQLAGDTFEAKSTLKRQLEGHEGQFANAYNRLFDGSQIGFDSNGKLITLDPRKNELFSGAVGYNATNKYLKDILAEVRYIRMYGLSGGRGKKKGSRGPSGPSFDSYLNSQKDFTDYTESDMYPEEDGIKDMKWYIEDKVRQDADREKSLAEKYGFTVKNLKEMESAKTIIEKWQALRKSVDNLLRSPAQMITKVINMADKRFFDAMFGTEEGKPLKDKNGFEYKGFLDYVVGRASQMFDELSNKMKNGFKSLWNKFKETTVGKWVTEKGGAFARNVGSRLKSKFGWAKNRGRQALSNTYGRLINKMRRGGVVSADEFEAARVAQPETYSDEYMDSGYGGIFGVAPDDSDIWNDIYNDQYSAHGRIVTKYGLSMLSPGEIVIPNPTGKARAMNLRGEKREKNKILRAIRGGHIGHNANGTQNTGRDESKVMSIIKKITREVGGDGADIVADALIGGGVSLITGMIGGPLLGAAAGAGIGLVKHSDTAKNFLFGEVGEDGERKGGVIPKSVTNFFKKHSEGMIDFGVAGGIAGLFTPLGLVGGALAGATIGFAKDTDWFKDTMFGNEEKGKTGLMSNETKEKLKKALPAMGIGAGIGLLTGPFGLVGNAILGSAAGYVATSSQFQEMILGKKGDDGKRSGGLAGAIKAGLVEPLADAVMGKKGSDGKRKGGILGEVRGLIVDDILGNTKKVFEVAGQGVKNAFLNIGDRIQDAISGVFKKHVGMPIEEYLREKVFKRLTGMFGGLLKGVVKAGRFVIGSPFRAAGYMADSARLRQIGRGIFDTMSAQERIDFRNKNKVRAANMQFSGRDKTYFLDQSLAGMSKDELEAFNANVKTFIKNRGTENIAYHNMLETAGSNISSYMTANGLWDNNKGYDLKKKILNLLQEGKLNDKAISDLQKKYNLTPDQMQGILSSIDRSAINRARQKAIDESGLDEAAVNAIQRATGYTNLNKAGNHYFKQMLRLGNTELRYRNRKGAEEPTKAEQAAIENSDPVVKNTSRMIDILISINNNIARGKGMRGKGQIIGEDGKPTEHNEDSKAIQDELRAIEQEEETQRSIATNLGMLTTGLKDFFGFKNNPEGEERKGIVSKVLGWLGDNKSALGKVALTIGGVSLLGYGSEFLKNNVWPAFQETGLYKKLDSLLESAKDGSLFIKMGDAVGRGLKWTLENVAEPAGHWLTGVFTNYLPKLAGGVAQGVAWAGKNIVGPLVKGIVISLPSIAVGVVKGVLAGIKALFWPGKDKSSAKTKIDAGQEMNEIYKSLPKGTYDSQITANFVGSSESNWNGIGTANAEIDYNTGMPVGYEGSSNFDPYGDIYRDNSGIGSRAVSNALKRGIATGATPRVASVLGNIGKKLFSNKSIAKSATNVITGGNNPLGFVNRLGSIINTAVKSGGRFVTGATNAAGNLGATLHRIINGGDIAAVAEFSNVGDNITSGIARFGDKIKSSKFGQVISGFKNKFAAKGAETAAEGATRVVDDVVEAGAKAADNIAAKAVKSGGIASKVTSFFGWLAKQTKFLTPVFNVLRKGTTKLKDTKVLSELIEKLGKSIASKCSGKLAGKAATKLLTALGNTTPIALAFWISSFAEGCWTKTETILGITKDSDFNLTPGIRVIVGLLNAINENLLLGIIDTGTILDVLVDVFGGFLGIDKDELRKAQEAADAIVEASEDGKSLAEINGQQGLWSKVKGFFKGSSRADTNTTSKSSANFSGVGRVVNTYGRGRGGQQGGVYANMKYGNSTIGQAGCAPVAAASILSGNIPEAARYAQMTGHVGSDGSTDIGFFGDYFSAKGISNRTTTNKSAVSRALDNGQSAVLLGRDPGGGYDSAYSNSSHYITARKGKNGNLIVNDPAIGIRNMSKGKVLRNMHASVITGRGRTTPYGNEIGVSTSASTNAQKVVNTALAEVGFKESGNNMNKYGAEYGYNGAAWCCIFIWWVFKHAGASALFYGGNKCASCTTLMNWYKNKGQQVSDIQPGDLLFFNFDSNPNRNKAQHIGIAVGYSNGTMVQSVEGNTSPSSTSGSQDNGEGVYKKNRKLSQIICVIRPAYAGATFDTAIPSDMYYNYETGEETSSAGGFFNSLLELGKSMVKAMFGENLYNAVFGEGEDQTTDNYPSSVVDDAGNLAGSNNSEKIWKYLRTLGYNENGAAAIMGSLQHESGMMPNNLQNTYEKALGSDSVYTKKINDGTYNRNKFMHDGGGYGLAQWTYNTRKAGLYDATIAKSKSISDMKSQLDFLNKEVSDMGLDAALKNAKSVSDANKIFVGQFERPAGSESGTGSVYDNRLKTANNYYDMYKGTGRTNSRFNNVGYARDDTTAPTVTAGAGTVSYTVFLETIVTLLMSMVDNTAALNKILDILSDKFDIKLSANEVNKINHSATTAEQAKDAINKLMASRTNAADVANILQTKNTNYLVEVMSSIARE